MGKFKFGKHNVDHDVFACDSKLLPEAAPEVRFRRPAALGSAE